MDALEVLKADHDKVRSLFMEFRAASEADDAEKMGEATAKIFEELEIHTAIEERVFYPEVKKAGGPDLADLTAESNEEHHVVALLIDEIKDLAPTDDRYAPKMTVLIENVEHHAGEVEKEMFPQVRNLLGDSELEELGAALEREKWVVKVDRMTVGDLQTTTFSIRVWPTRRSRTARGHYAPSRFVPIGDRSAHL